MLRWLFKLARTPAVGYLVGLVFAHFSFIIPTKRLRETSSLVAFYHPQPSYPIHILIVAKKQCRDLAALTETDADFMADLITVTNSLVAELGLEPAGYRLINNGGTYQDVKHLHFHLISGTDTPTHSAQGKLAAS